jgi:hypothetical protein
MLCERLGGLLFSLGNFHFVTCNAYKILMKGSCNLLAYLKVTKNVEGPSCQIIANDFFVTSQNSNELDKLFKSWYNLKLRYNYGSYNFSSLKKG